MQRKRDGDGDGFVDDGTPLERPWVPGVDLGPVEDAAKAKPKVPGGQQVPADVAVKRGRVGNVDTPRLQRRRERLISEIDDPGQFYKGGRHGFAMRAAELTVIESELVKRGDLKVKDRYTVSIKDKVEVPDWENATELGSSGSGWDGRVYVVPDDTTMDTGGRPYDHWTREVPILPDHLLEWVAEGANLGGLRNRDDNRLDRMKNYARSLLEERAGGGEDDSWGPTHEAIWDRLTKGQDSRQALSRAIHDGPTPEERDFYRLLHEHFLDFAARRWPEHGDVIPVQRMSTEDDPFTSNVGWKKKAEQPKAGSSGFTSWDAMDYDEPYYHELRARRSRSGATTWVGDVPKDQILGRFGDTENELLIAKDPETLQRLIGEPDSPFATTDTPGEVGGAAAPVEMDDTFRKAVNQRGSRVNAEDMQDAWAVAVANPDDIEAIRAALPPIAIDRWQRLHGASPEESLRRGRGGMPSLEGMIAHNARRLTEAVPLTRDNLGVNGMPSSAEIVEHDPAMAKWLGITDRTSFGELRTAIARRPLANLLSDPDPEPSGVRYLKMLRRAAERDVGRRGGAVTLHRANTQGTDSPFDTKGGSGLTSWTSDYATAAKYAKGGVEVHSVDVPADRILAFDTFGIMASTGFYDFAGQDAYPLPGREVIVTSPELLDRLDSDQFPLLPSAAAGEAPAAPVAIAAAAKRDGDSDGFVDDGLPTMRPAVPLPDKGDDWQRTIKVGRARQGMVPGTTMPYPFAHDPEGYQFVGYHVTPDPEFDYDPERRATWRLPEDEGATLFTSLKPDHWSTWNGGEHAAEVWVRRDRDVRSDGDYAVLQVALWPNDDVKVKKVVPLTEAVRNLRRLHQLRAKADAEQARRLREVRERKDREERVRRRFDIAPDYYADRDQYAADNDYVYERTPEQQRADAALGIYWDKTGNKETFVGAVDGDGDGFVNDGTPQMRPVGPGDIGPGDLPLGKSPNAKYGLDHYTGELRRGQNGDLVAWRPCGRCGGSGRFGGGVCYGCNGRGGKWVDAKRLDAQMRSQRELDVKAAERRKWAAENPDKIEAARRERVERTLVEDYGVLKGKVLASRLNRLVDEHPDDEPLRSVLGPVLQRSVGAKSWSKDDRASWIKDRLDEADARLNNPFTTTEPDGDSGGDYRMNHTSPDRESGAAAHDLTGANEVYPKDFWDNPRFYWYNPETDPEVTEILRRIKGNPDAEVTIYRSLPPEHVDEGINPNDWVTLSKKYAEGHGMHPDDPSKDWPVVERTVRAGDVFTAGDSLSEWGWDPAGPFATTEPDGDSSYASSSKYPGMRPVTAEERKGLTVEGRPIPPAWTDVHVAVDPDAAMQVRGLDGKGRHQYIYSIEHQQRAAAAKYARTKELATRVPKLDAAIERDAMTDPAAAATALIRHFGLRPGSTSDTKARKKAYGATTLQARHVRQYPETGRTTLSFVGKSGVNITVSTRDPDIYRIVEHWKGDKEGTVDLFPADDADVRAYVTEHLGEGFKAKDLRTLLANVMALDMVSSMRRPTTQAKFKAARNKIADAVAKALGNTRAVTLSNYIDPTVFAAWEGALP